jgi:hypothetical protein
MRAEKGVQGHDVGLAIDRRQGIYVEGWRDVQLVLDSWLEG